jgi:anti-sigma factor RsiW
MDCERCANDLTAYLDGELSGTRSLEVKSHLEICQPCREEYRSLELSARFVETHVRELQVQPKIWNHVQAHISVMEAPAPSPGLFQLLTMNPWWSAAGTVVAAAALVLGLWSYLHNQAVKRDLIQYMTQYIQAREVQEQAHQAQAFNLENAGAEADPVHPEYTDNPFVTANSTPDMNPFRSEDQ